MDNQSPEAVQDNTEAAEAQETGGFEADAFDQADAEPTGETADQQTQDSQQPEGGDAESGEGEQTQAEETEDAEDAQQEETQEVDLAAVPETPDGYRLNLPEGYAEIPGLTSRFRAKAHEMDLTQGHFDGITDVFHEFAAEAAAEQKKLALEVETADKAEVAKRFGVKDGDAEGLQKVYQRATDGFLAVGKSMGIDGQKIVETLVDSGLANQPDIAALGVWLHKLTNEDGGPTPEPGEGAGPVDTETHYQGMFKE